MPDPERPGSERVKVVIEPEPGTDLIGADVLEHLEDRVPRQATPMAVEFTDEMPLTDVGKINKQALKEAPAEASDDETTGEETGEADVTA